MTRDEFISLIAPLIRHYAPMYNIKVYSPIIAQAILESGGTSELAVNCHNYFGLKWREGRCPTSIGYYIKDGAEQNPDGSYTSSTMKWMKFATMEDGVKGYFDFINNSNYSNLKGVTDAYTYLKNIKEDGYATSINYVENLMNVIKKYNLTRFDCEVKRMLKVAIDCGHGINTPGKRCMKKLDVNETREWVLNARIGEKLETLLKDYECDVLRVDDVTGVKDISLSDRVTKANNWKADVYISIHHNAGINGGKGGGTVVFYYSSSKMKKLAQSLYDCLVSNTKLIGNRFSKVVVKNYYVIKNTKMDAFLIENGFMDSKTDIPIILSESHATKTTEGLLEFLKLNYGLKAKQNEEGQKPTKTLYKVQCGAFSSRTNAEALVKRLSCDGYDGVIVEE